MKGAGDSAEGWVWRKQITCCCSIWVTGPETAAMFGRTTSNCCWPLLWRIPILLWSIGTIAWSLADFWGPVYMWPLYMTHWGLILIFLQSFLGCIVALNGARGRLIDDPKYELPGYVKSYWTLYNMAIPIAFLITFFYWALLRGFFYGPIMPIPNPESVNDIDKLVMLDDENPEETTLPPIIIDEPLPEINAQQTTAEFEEIPPTDTESNTNVPITDTESNTNVPVTDTESNTNVPVTDTESNTNVPVTDIELNANVTETEYDPNTTTENVSDMNDKMTEYIPNINDSFHTSTTIAASTATKKPLMYSPDPTLDLFIHGVNSIIMLVELLTAGHPSRLLHVWQPLLVACSYMLVGVVYFAADGTDPAGNHWIYPMIDWSKPEQALLVSFLCAVYISLMHALVVLVASIRDKISKACCPTPNTLVLYDGCSGWSVR